MGTGVGLDIEATVGQTLGSMLNEAMSDLEKEPQLKCSNCNAPVKETDKFCGNCASELDHK